MIPSLITVLASCVPVTNKIIHAAFFVVSCSPPSPLTMRATVSPILLAFSSALSVAAGVHEVWWNLSYAYDVSPDGLGVPRRAIGVNGTWPSVFSLFLSRASSPFLREFVALRRSPSA